MDAIVIGKFGKAHGLRGEVRLWCYNASSPLWEREKLACQARDEAGALRDLTITRVRFADRFAIVKIAGVASREQADALCNQEVVVSRDQFEALEEDELYLVDTIGWPALIDHDGARYEVGTISGFAETGASDIMRVALCDGGTWLVPMLDHCLLELAPERERVVLAPLDQWAAEDAALPVGARKIEE